MKKLFVILAVMPVVLNAACCAASARTVSDKDALVQRFYWYEELLASANSEDVIAMETSDFVNVQLDQKQFTREQSDAYLRIDVDHIYRIYGSNVRINQLDIHGSNATVVFTQYFNADYRNDTGETLRIISNMIARQQWVKTEFGWQVKRSRTLRGHVTVDGERIDF